MKGRTVIIGLLLLTVGLAGCIGDDGPADEGSEEVSEQSIDQEDVEVPEGAKLQEVEDGYRLLWEKPELPINTTLKIPEGTVAVNATIDVPDDARGYVNITNANTSHVRCLTPEADSLQQPKLGKVSCTGLTTLDDLPAEWQIEVSANTTEVELVTVDLLTVPLDGLLSELDPSQLSKAVHEIKATESFQVAAEDGTQLHVEVTRPDVETPVPTVLVTGLAAQAQAQGPQLTTPLNVDSLAKDLAMRGYAVAYAHVRGTGQSGGCLDMWGPKEQADQLRLVEWLSEQNWTNDKLATYGVGYSATTAIEAAIQAPDQVDAVLTFGAVTDAYRDWHFGGVPNGEGVADPVTSQLTGALGYAPSPDAVSRITGNSQDSCDAAQYTDAADPRAVYNAFYEARNLTTKAQEITAPMLYGQGLNDRLTKPAMALDMVNQVKSPVIGLVGPWANQLPTRADTQTLIVGFLDQHLKDREVGLTTETTISVTQDLPVQRLTEAWPPSTATVTKLYPGFDAGQLQDAPAEGSTTIVMDPIAASASAGQGDNRTLVTLRGSVDQDVLISGPPALDLAAVLQGLDNAFVAAYLYDVAPDGSRELISFGMANLAHRNGHAEYAPVTPGEALSMAAPMQPVETVIEANHTIELQIRSAASTDWTLVQPGKPGALTLQAGAQGTVLLLPTLPTDQLEDLPATVQPKAVENATDVAP